VASSPRWGSGQSPEVWLLLLGLVLGLIFSRSEAKRAARTRPVPKDSFKGEFKGLL
jgi:hypothetical protein